MNKRIAIVVVTSIIAVVSAFVLRAGGQEPTPQQAEFFDKKIKPLLENNCYQCHSHKSGKSKGGLVVDSRGALMKGGETGPAIVPGDPDKSLLFHGVSYKDDEFRMPPRGKLAEEQIALFREWIKQGAPWPGSSEEKIVRTPGKITAEDRAWWAFQPVKKPALPDVADAEWSVNPIDRFIRARLDKEGLKPSPVAERLALIRRVTFDLIGLPPTPQEIDTFVKDETPGAYDKLVDRLLASPRYGEKWARHWLDLVRYAESDGYRADEYRPHAWHYREYVVKAFNSDKPYDQFVREQLAGDELASDDPDALVATGFLRHTIYEFNQRDARTQWQTMLDDVTDVTADVFLGLGMGCARCHDHKYDPILQKDYYALQAFFAAMFPKDVPLASKSQQAEHDRKLQEWQAKTKDVRAKLEQLIAKDKKRLENEAVTKFPPDIQAMMRKPADKRGPFEQQLATLAFRQVTYEWDRLDKKMSKDGAKAYGDLQQELSKFDGIKPAALPVVMAMTDVGPQAPVIRIPKKGKAPEVEPAYLTVLGEQTAALTPPASASSTGRRLALAQWLTRPDHPLTTRVIVNRLWQYLFDAGLVTTASDFGKLGEPPSHPELLDWLTNRFVEDGWSTKKLIRLMVTSRTYRQAATSPAAPEALKKDPENRLLWRKPTRRLDAEQIRDTILQVTGKLDLTMGGPSVDAKTPRRSIYTKMFRNTRDPLLDVFDAPEGVSSTPQRNVTTTPVQALLMVNSPFMLAQAKAFAERVAKENNPVQSAYRLAFGRTATAQELTAAQAFLAEQAKRAGGPQASRTALVDFCHVLLNANEFLYVD